MARYAENTSVSVEKSRAEIEGTLRRYGASGFMSGWRGNRAQIGFLMKDRHIRFVLPLPAAEEKRFTHYRHSSGRLMPRSADAAAAAYEAGCRQSWRALALVVKAKLEAVAAGIAEFESEFMANIVMPDGRTVAEHALPAIAAAYRSGSVQNLLPDYSQG